MNSYSVIVPDVDGRSDTRNPVMIESGRHVIRVQGPPAPGGSPMEKPALLRSMSNLARAIT